MISEKKIFPFRKRVAGKYGFGRNDCWAVDWKAQVKFTAADISVKHVLDTYVEKYEDALLEADELLRKSRNSRKTGTARYIWNVGHFADKFDKPVSDHRGRLVNSLDKNDEETMAERRRFEFSLVMMEIIHNSGLSKVRYEPFRGFPLCLKPIFEFPKDIEPIHHPLFTFRPTKQPVIMAKDDQEEEEVCQDCTCCLSLLLNTNLTSIAVHHFILQSKPNLGYLEVLAVLPPRKTSKEKKEPASKKQKTNNANSNMDPKPSTSTRLSGYALYKAREFASFVAANLNMPRDSIATAFAQQYQSLPEGEKQKYQDGTIE